MPGYNYICLDCGALFDEPAHWEERHGLSTPPYEHFTGCPFCQGGYDEAIECKRCGATVPKSEAFTDSKGNYLCDSCMNEDLEDYD